MIQNTTPEFSITINRKEYHFWTAVVKLSDLRISEARQRRFSRKWCDEIKRQFDPRKVRITVAVREDGSLWIVGGQHCKTAAMELGVDEFLVTVVQGYGYEDETELQDGLNRAKKPAPADLTKNRYERKDPGLRVAVELIEGEGFVYDRDSRAWNVIRDPAMIEKFIAVFSPAHLKETLRFMRGTWEGEKGCCLAQNIFAIGSLLRDWRTASGSLPYAELQRVVSLIKPVDLGPAAARRPFTVPTRKIEQRGEYIAEYIVEEFNHGRSKNRLTKIRK